MRNLKKGLVLAVICMGMFVGNVVWGTQSEDDGCKFKFVNFTGIDSKEKPVPNLYNLMVDVDDLNKKKTITIIKVTTAKTVLKP